MNDTPGSEERKSVPSSSNVTTGTLTRAQSLRQQFAESRNSISAGTPPVAVRWHAQHQSTATRRPPSDGGAGDSSSSKSPSPSRKTGEFKRPTSVTWMMGNSTLLTQSGARRPATPTAGISDSVADEQSDYSPAGISGTCRHDPTVTDDSNGQYVHVPTNKVWILVGCFKCNYTEREAGTFIIKFALHKMPVLSVLNRFHLDDDVWKGSNLFLVP